MRVKNWKTTLFGFSTILSGIVLIIKHQASEGIINIITGLGLSFAKDHNS
jgi:hypothetical protein